LLHSSRKHLDRQSFPTRRSSDLNRLDPGGEGETSRNIITEEKLPERFLSGELLELTTAKCAALKEKRGHPFVVRIQHFELPRLSDRKSTRLNSSHVAISYAVFCL